MKKGLNKKDFSIEEVHGLEVLDSRGNPTVLRRWSFEMRKNDLEEKE